MTTRKSLPELVPVLVFLLLTIVNLDHRHHVWAWISLPTFADRRPYFTSFCTSRTGTLRPLAPYLYWYAIPKTLAAVDRHIMEDCQHVFQSQVLGSIRRIKLPGEDSFLGSMGVPTFAVSTLPVSMVDTSATNNDNLMRFTNSLQPLAASTIPTSVWGLEGSLRGLGPSFLLPNALNISACNCLIDELESIGFGNFEQGKNNHGAMQVVVSQELADSVARQLSPHINIAQVEALRLQMLQATAHANYTGQARHDNDDDDDDDTGDTRLGFVGLNRRWRMYRYDSTGKESFAPHIDAGFPPSGLSEDGSTLVWDSTSTGTTQQQENESIVSRLTVLLYLNDDFVGGETNFYQPLVESCELRCIASVRPQAGSILVFPQGVGEEAVQYARQYWPLHEGTPVLPGSHRPKYIIRSDALFVSQHKPTSKDLSVNGDDDDARLFQYDHLVRKAFLPQSQAFHSNFLSHIASLYNPHMGVENLGPWLYSFLRFTKQQQIVEIGAGYTSLWILQALQDNDQERNRIQALENDGTCRLLDIEWTIPQATTSSTTTFHNSSSLLCIDNCLHQKETATGALAVAQTLGLDSYLQFRKGDAFEELALLQPGTVDVLWCDFGVGSRIQEFVSSGAWDSIRPGGFLLCHSTLTNLNTRTWLEKVRAKQPKEETGLDPNEYSELSLLEPHKRFQNSITILQKRIEYSEPIYSKYA